VLVEPDVFEATMSHFPSEESQASDKQDQRWRQYCLESGIRDLPSSQRDALNLVVYSELPQKQAADILGVSLKALESLLIRAKRNLNKHIELLSRQAAENRELTAQRLSEESNA
jgi:RNA polymerase sigma-70 factor (ECF subfamily)